MKRIVSVLLIVGALVSALVNTGCDPEARETILAGIETGTQSFVAALVTATFESIAAGIDDGTTQTTTE